QEMKQPTPMISKVPSQTEYPSSPPATQATTVPVSTPPKPYVAPAYSAPAPDKSIEKLWESGILSTVDSKLAQMEKMKNELDNVIEGKVIEHYVIIEKKMEALFDAQRELFRFKMDAALDSKTKEIEQIFDSKITEIKQMNLATQEDLQRVKGQKMIIQDLVADITTKTESLEQTRRMIIDDATRKLETLQDKVNELVQTTDERVHDVEMRATKTLELEEKITSGLTEQVETQADRILETKVKDLREEMRGEIIQLKKLGADLGAQDIQKTLQDFVQLNKEMETRKAEIDALVTKKSNEMDAMTERKTLDIDKIVNLKMETIVANKEKEFFTKIESESTELQKTHREIGQKILEIETTMQNLDLFKKQFLDIVKKANQEREDETIQLKKKMEAFDGRANEKISLVESRLKQLDLVVGQLSQLLVQMQGQQQSQAAQQQVIDDKREKDAKNTGGFFGLKK
ncbi:MAG: hypothetical protein AABX02_00650, partial [archaeon]